jgi:hypothetical protein
MNQDTTPAPFNLGDHVRYVAAQRRAFPAGHGSETELVLAPGMEGVIVLSRCVVCGRRSGPQSLALWGSVSKRLPARHHSG